MINYLCGCTSDFINSNIFICNLDLFGSRLSNIELPVSIKPNNNGLLV